MRFENAEDSEKEYFRALNKACYEDVVERQFGPWDEAHQNMKFDIKWVKNKFRKILIDDVVVGGVWIDDDPDYVQLREIQVHPQFQRQGIGTAIIKMEIDKARRLGKAIRLRVLFENRVVDLYKRLGFNVIDSNEHQYIMERT